MTQLAVDDVLALQPDEFGCVRVREGKTHWVDVIPTTFGRGRIVITPKLSPLTYDDGWCYDSFLFALLGAAAWDPDEETEPQGWVKHVSTGRRRPNGDASQEYVAP